MTKIIANAYDMAAERRAAAAAFLLAISAAAAVYYAYAVYGIVSRTAALEKLNSRTAAVSDAVDSLDSAYLKLSRSVTPDMLSAHGLSEGKVSAYIDKSVSTALVAPVQGGSHEL